MNVIRLFTIISIAFIGFNFSLLAQKDTTTNMVDKISSSYRIDMARRDFTSGNVRGALVQFREAYNIDPNSFDAAYWIGECQYKLTNYGYAIKYARIALELKKKADPEIHFLIAKSFHRSMDLDSAILHYNKAIALFTKPRAEELSATQYLEEAKRAKEWSAKPAAFERQLFSGDVNSGFDDYAPILTENGKKIYFVSRRSSTTGGKVNPDDQQFFEDIYSGDWNEATQQYDSINNKFDRLNSDGFDAISHITANGEEVYLTINNTMVPDIKKPTKSSDICLSKLTKRGTWSSPRPVSGINSSFFDGGASLTADGMTLYFASERSGTIGGSDIWVSHSSNGKTWSKPSNLGKVINTKGQETTPFISEDGKYLFFSSNKGEGIGDYDIYVAEFDGTRFSKPVNLGLNINSVNNDSHFRYYPELKKAVFSSIRLIDNKASYDNFWVDMTNFNYPKFEYPIAPVKK